MKELGWRWLCQLRHNRQVALPGQSNTPLAALTILREGLMAPWRGHDWARVFRIFSMDGAGERRATNDLELPPEQRQVLTAMTTRKVASPRVAPGAAVGSDPASLGRLRTITKASSNAAGWKSLQPAATGPVGTVSEWLCKPFCDWKFTGCEPGLVGIKPSATPSAQGCGGTWLTRPVSFSQLRNSYGIPRLSPRNIGPVIRCVNS